MKRSRIAALVAIGAALVGTTLLKPPPKPVSRRAAAATATIWEDNFDGPAGQAPDPAKWRYDIGGCGWGNNERQYYTNSTRNAALDGAGQPGDHRPPGEPGDYQCRYGTCQYTSARLLTAQTFTQTYGRFEARIKIPGARASGRRSGCSARGNWPNDGEIDIMENIGREPNTVHGTIHGPGYSGAGGIGAGVQPSGRAAVRRRLPHLRGRLGAERDHLVRRRRPVPAPHAGRPGRQHAGSSTTRSS